jgi:hypothetical protein
MSRAFPDKWSASGHFPESPLSIFLGVSPSRPGANPADDRAEIEGSDFTFSTAR